MNKGFTDDGWEDYLWFQKNDKKSLKRVILLIKNITRSPFDGIGKAEPLNGNFTGYWSRRVNYKDRLIYSVSNNNLTILACRTHYDDK